MPITSFHHNAAKDMAERSPDPSTKVGCVIVDHRRGVTVGAGWNQFPEGVDPANWNLRPAKYLHVVHAEAIALLAAGPAAKGCDLYVTHHPCRECAKLIAAVGIRTVYSPKRAWRDDPEVNATCHDAAIIFQSCNVLHIGD